MAPKAGKSKKGTIKPIKRPASVKSQEIRIPRSLAADRITRDAFDLTKFVAFCLGSLRPVPGKLLRLGTACTGMDTPSYVAQKILPGSVQVPFACDNARHVVLFCLKSTGVPKSAHFCEDIAELAAADSAPCWLHGSVCCAKTANLDLIVIGFLCKLNSEQNPGRYEQDALRPSQALMTFEAAIALIVRIKPKRVILENVRGTRLGVVVVLSKFGVLCLFTHSAVYKVFAFGIFPIA